MRASRRKDLGLDRQQSLACQVIRNPGVREQSREDGRLVLQVATRPTGWARLLAGRKRDEPIMRRFELDDLGREIWDRCEDGPTVEKLIRDFAADHQLNLREAEVSVLSFCRILIRRGLVVVAMPKEKNQ